jgi:hypothetical protein
MGPTKGGERAPWPAIRRKKIAQDSGIVKQKGPPPFLLHRTSPNERAPDTEALVACLNVHGPCIPSHIPAWSSPTSNSANLFSVHAPTL